ncbi:MAG: Fic family protein [Candidatus Omnitrophica bacterium]|nr:Fic family protein [Candidatus Omnitrophota bacterium]MDD5592056.1 Fic family protein [Candidatus Omnitrophota bacterium]
MPFNPKYTITDKILNNLTAITSAREVIEQAHLVPKWEAKLRRDALVRNTHSSTAIEGNKLTLEQVKALAEGKDVIATNKDKIEALNYIEALERIPSLAEKEKFKVADLLNIHRIITKNVMQNTADSGVLRNRQVFVGKRIFDGTTFKEVIEYMPPKTEEVPQLVQEFTEWLNLDKSWGLNPVLLAGIVHYEIARIHPFIDGNGRTARLVATLILYLSGLDHRRIFALDDYYDRDRQAYYAALKTAQTSNGDITKWLEYFTDGILYSVNEAKDAVLKVGSKRKNGQAQIALTPKQMKIVEYININGKVTNRELQGIFKISAQAVHKELVKLVELKVIKSVGEGRALHYILV